MRLLLLLPVCFAVGSDGAGTPPAAPDFRPAAADAPRYAAADPPPAATADDREALARTDPVAFYRLCVAHYDRTVTGYTLTFHKRERLKGRLHDVEVIAVAFRDDPFSVLFDWKKGQRLASKTLYVKGANDDKLLVRPAGLLGVAGVVARDPDGDEAKSGGRYPLTEFGLRLAAVRTLRAWEDAAKAETLAVYYLGRQRVEQVGGRDCHVFRRTPYRPAEEDGINDLVVFVDAETLLQVGSILLDAKGDLIAEYFFRDVALNPPFPEGTFTRQSLQR